MVPLFSRLCSPSWLPVYITVSRISNPTAVAATRRLFWRVAATVVGLESRALHCILIMVRVGVRGRNGPISACTTYKEAVTANIEAATAHIEVEIAGITPVHHI